MPQTQQFSIEEARDIAQIVGALGTLLAVLVALFGSQIRRFIFKPRLNIELSPNGGSFSNAPYFKDENKDIFLPSLWYHLRVSNPNQFQPIMEVYVYLVRIETLDASGKYVVSSREELPMHWRYGGKPNPPRNFGHPFECDIFRVFEDHHLELTPIYTSNRIKPMKGDVHIRLSFQASGLEAWSDVITIQVDWNGKWSTDPKEMVKNLVVKEVARTKPDWER